MRNYQLVNIRSVSILIVMFGHSIIIYDQGWGILTTDVVSPLFSFIKHLINVIQMPLFFSISGFCFAYSFERTNLKSLVNKKFLRLIIPYIFIAILWMNPIKYFLKIQGYENINILQQQLLLSKNGHLWYLPCLFAIFILSFCLLKIFHNKRTCTQIITISVILNITSNFMPSIFEISDIFRYLIYFIVGYYLNTEQFKKVKINSLILCLFFFTSYILTMCLSGKSIKLTEPILISTILICIYKLFPTKTNKELSFIDKNSFGLYLFHSPMVYISYKYVPNINPCAMLLINFIFFGGISIILIYMTRFFNLNFIIGEYKK